MDRLMPFLDDFQGEVTPTEPEDRVDAALGNAFEAIHAAKSGLKNERYGKQLLLDRKEYLEEANTRYRGMLREQESTVRKVEHLEFENKQFKEEIRRLNEKLKRYVDGNEVLKKQAIDADVSKRNAERYMDQMRHDPEIAADARVAELEEKVKRLEESRNKIADQRNLALSEKYALLRDNENLKREAEILQGQNRRLADMVNWKTDEKTKADLERYRSLYLNALQVKWETIVEKGKLQKKLDQISKVVREQALYVKTDRILEIMNGDK